MLVVIEPLESVLKRCLDFNVIDTPTSGFVDDPYRHTVTIEIPDTEGQNYEKLLGKLNKKFLFRLRSKLAGNPYKVVSAPDISKHCVGRCLHGTIEGFECRIVISYDIEQQCYVFALSCYLQELDLG
jgi:hypothetical protein